MLLSLGVLSSGVRSASDTVLLLRWASRGDRAPPLGTLLMVRDQTGDQLAANSPQSLPVEGVRARVRRAVSPHLRQKNARGRSPVRDPVLQGPILASVTRLLAQ